MNQFGDLVLSKLNPYNQATAFAANFPETFLRCF